MAETKRVKLGNVKGPKGDPFQYEDFTAEQLANLKGDPGPRGPAGNGSKILMREDGRDLVELLNIDKGTNNTTVKRALAVFKRIHDICQGTDPDFTQDDLRVFDYVNLGKFAGVTVSGSLPSAVSTRETNDMTGDWVVMIIGFNGVTRGALNNGSMASWIGKKSVQFQFANCPFKGWMASSNPSNKTTRWSSLELGTYLKSSTFLNDLYARVNRNYLIKTYRGSDGDLECFLLHEVEIGSKLRGYTDEGHQSPLGTPLEAFKCGVNRLKRFNNSIYYYWTGTNDAQYAGDFVNVPGDGLFYGNAANYHAFGVAPAFCVG